MSIIEIESLTRRYHERRGVESINLCVPAGTLFGFLGPNGAGKSTAIRVLVGLLRPTSGSARIFGLDCWQDSRAIKADIGYIPGDLRLPGWMNGWQALRIAGQVRGRSLAEHGQALAERFELDLAVKVNRMSRGMRQKLGLILAVVHKPRLLILDEPTVTLDPLMQRVFHELLSELAAAGHTVFFSSHTLSEVEQLCQRVAIIRDGRIVADQTLEELRARAGHQVRIHWRAAADAAGNPPPFLQLEHRSERIWNALLTGPVEPLVAWLAGRELIDLQIGPADLETLFRRHYTGEERRP